MQENAQHRSSDDGQRSSERDVSQTSATDPFITPVTLDSFIGCLQAGSFLGFSIQELREEWE